MTKINIYIELGLNQYFLGGAIQIVNSQFDLSSDTTILNAIDNVSIEENLLPLSNEWNQINYKDFEILLQQALQYNLGFTKHEVMPYSKAVEIFNKLIKNFDIDNCLCFTNWLGNPWMNENGDCGSYSISNGTLDMAISIIDKNKLLFIYFLFED